MCVSQDGSGLLRFAGANKIRIPAHRTFVPLLIVLSIGWLVRVYALDVDSFWGDEILSYSRASHPSLEVAYELLRASNHAPLYDLGVLRLWQRLGANEFFLRFPSAFFGLLTISIVYVLGKAAFNAQIGILSAFLLAVSSFHVYYSREARLYALLACLIAFGVYCLHKAIRSPRHLHRYWIGFAFSSACSIYTHYYAGFTLWALAGFMLVRLAIKPDPGLFKRWTVANLSVVTAFLPWVPTFRSQLQGQPVPWIEPTSFDELRRLPVYFFVRPEVISGRLWLIAAWSVWMALAFGFIGLIGARKTKPTWSEAYLLLVACVAGTFLIAFRFSLLKPLIVARYFTGIVPAICVLVAFGVCNLQPRWMALLIVVTMSVAASFSSYRVAASRWQEDWRGVTTIIESNSLPGDTILLFLPDNAQFWKIPFDHYYDGDLAVTCFAGELSNDNDVTTALGSLAPHNRVWIVQPARFTSGGPLGDLTSATYPHHRLLFRQVFDHRVAFSALAVDVLCLEFVEE
jgi:mannosyltransferase